MRRLKVQREMFQAGTATHSWTPKHLLTASVSQEGLSNPYASLQTLAISLTFCLHNTTWLRCLAIGHSINLCRGGKIPAPKLPKTPKAVDFSLSEHISGLQVSNRCLVFPVRDVWAVALVFLALCPK